MMLMHSIGVRKSVKKMIAKCENITITSLKELVAKHAHFPLQSITEESRLVEDLYIVGDDADELLEEISVKFCTDFSEMESSEYFPGEATAGMHYHLAMAGYMKRKSGLIKFIFRLESLFWRFFVDRKSLKTVTVRQLFVAIENGKWTDG